MFVSLTPLLLAAVFFMAVGYLIGWLVSNKACATANQDTFEMKVELAAVSAISLERAEALATARKELLTTFEENGRLRSETESANRLIAIEQDGQRRTLEAKDKQIDQLREFIDGAKEALTTEFKALSGDVLRNASEQLTKTTDSLLERHGKQTTGDVQLHKNEIKAVLQPVSAAIANLDRHVSESERARTAAQAVFDEQVNRLAAASESLTDALKKPVIRGSWGEVTLENALENAGLRPQIDYVLQHHTDAEDGRKRTDAVINLPKGRKLIIDSKNLMDTYVAFMACKDETQKATLGIAHSRSLRAHIKSLSDQKYWTRYQGLDCVILFVPHDGMYHAAIQDEADLIRNACNRRVFVANPMSLIPLLKAVGYVLDQERLNASAQQISKVGTELYTELTRFAVNVQVLGSKLTGTVTAFNNILPGLDRFIIAKSRTLKSLGAGKGDEAELPDLIDIEPKLFSSRELSGPRTHSTEVEG
jgi:DNA recombination protein RmuC